MEKWGNIRKKSDVFRPHCFKLGQLHFEPTTAHVPLKCAQVWLLVSVHCCICLLTIVHPSLVPQPTCCWNWLFQSEMGTLSSVCVHPNHFYDKVQPLLPGHPLLSLLPCPGARDSRIINSKIGKKKRSSHFKSKNNIFEAVFKLTFRANAFCAPFVITRRHFKKVLIFYLQWLVCIAASWLTDQVGPC